MRQDQRFAPGQAVSAPLFARYLEETFDWLVTADPHLHRIGALDEVFGIPTERIVTAPLLAEWIGTYIVNPVLLGPDGESKQWVAEAARLVACLAAGAARVVSTDSIPHPSNAISLAPALAGQMMPHLGRGVTR